MRLSALSLPVRLAAATVCSAAWAATPFGLDSGLNEQSPVVSEAIRINYASAADIASAIHGLDACETSARSSLLVGADERSNSLLVLADARELEKLRPVIASFDKEWAEILVECFSVELDDKYSPKKTGKKFEGLSVGNVRTSHLLLPETLISEVHKKVRNDQADGLDYLGYIASDLPSIYRLANERSDRWTFHPGFYGEGGNCPFNLFIGESDHLGIELDLSPTVQQPGQIRLEIRQKIASPIYGVTNIANLGTIPLGTRTADLQVITVQDGATVVLAGMVETTRIQTVLYPPFLHRAVVLEDLMPGLHSPQTRKCLAVLLRLTTKAPEAKTGIETTTKGNLEFPTPARWPHPGSQPPASQKSPAHASSPWIR